MLTKNMQYKQIINEFDQIRLSNLKEQKARQEKIYIEIPKIKQLDEELNQKGINFVKYILENKNDTKNYSKSFKSHNAQLTLKKENLLVKNGYDKDFLTLKYRCNICKDEGFIDNLPCSCFKKALINLAYKQSNLENLMKKENFDNFNFNLYSDEIVSYVSPRAHMEQIQKHMLAFIERFPEYKNFIFQGESGLGKTFLCNCIAKEVLDRGNIVLYLSAPQLFKLTEKSRFNNEYSSKDMLDGVFSADLLIIDDLGTEFITSFIGPDLFNILNTRHINSKSTIISTNLQSKDWQERYSERIVSRFIGNFERYKFIGSDIRLKEKYKI
ncbi:hypothetical protein AN641_02545 [Candidatus Epulonipiscioides gigas]|nr:hypothetical protein AN641_02545 [Epulopiscium sp. SCG-C07WGA-EpuloA2]